MGPMSTELSLGRRLALYFRLLLGIPNLFRKYDVRQALRISRNMLKQSAEGIFGERAVHFLRKLGRLAWRLCGPALIGWAIYRASAVGARTYLALWQIFVLLVLGLTLSVSALGDVTLQPRAQRVFRPFVVLPVRLLLLGALYVPIAMKLSFSSSLIFAGILMGAYFLIGPLIGQWLQLWSFQWGSPRKADLAQAMNLPMVDEASKLRLCAHEAGHALMYGLGDSIPEDLYLYVDEDLVGDGIGGAVMCAEEFTADQTTLENLRFRLMVLAAGAAGERVRLGNMSLSAIQDFLSFEALATFYLLCAGYPVFAEPKTHEQFEVNAAALAKLRAEMLELAEAVISANRDVHEELTQLLLSRNELAYDDVLPTLSKTRSFPHAPRPKWAAKTVTHALIRA